MTARNHPSRREAVVGIDFAGPATANRQRRKILAVAATRLGPKTYRVSATGLNATLLSSPPGWTALTLADAIVAPDLRVSVVAPDFPFSLPKALLGSDAFAARVGAPAAFRTWKAFHSWVRAGLSLECPLDYSPFAAWRDKSLWVRRACDGPCGAQPPLKHAFQVLFNMTLLGNAFLGHLEKSGKFDVVPFQQRGRYPVIEIYPGHAMRKLGVPGYKRAPGEAIDAMLAHLRERGISFDLDPAIRRTCETYDSGHGPSSDHDAADALVACAVAVLYREGAATGVDGEQAERVEGAIWSV